MNETYGMSTSEGISQDNSVSNFYPDLSRVMQVWLLLPGYANLEISSRLSLGYPNLRNLSHDIPGYPDLPRVSFFQMS